MLTNADITVYNKYLDVNKDDKYKKTEIRNVSWNATKGINRLRTATETADAVTVVVYMNGSDAQDKEYKKPKEWRNTPNMDMEKFFTLAPEDIIVKGIVDYDINIGGVKGLEKAYDDVFKIKSVDTNTNASLSLQNWLVSAG